MEGIGVDAVQLNPGDRRAIPGYPFGLRWQSNRNGQRAGERRCDLLRQLLLPSRHR